MKLNKIHSELESRGYELERNIKIPSHETPKYNGIFKKDDENYFIKAFSGFKRKYLKREKLIREKVRDFQGRSLLPHEYFECPEFNCLVLPYIHSRGTLEGKEQNFSEEIFSVMKDFHDLPLSFLEGIKPYKPIQRMLEIRKNLPNSYTLLSSHLEEARFIFDLSYELMPTINDQELVFSHNDFNGDNMLQSLEEKVIINDYEGCSPNHPFEDVSTLVFYNLLKTDTNLENNILYDNALDFIGRSNSRLLDFFTLYRGLRTYEYLEKSKTGFLKDLKKDDIVDVNKSLIGRLKL